MQNIVWKTFDFECLLTKRFRAPALSGQKTIYSAGEQAFGYK
jgi:hypothetical protein